MNKVDKFFNGLLKEEMPKRMYVWLTHLQHLINEERTLRINNVVKQSELCTHNAEPILDEDGFYECPLCGKYGEDC